MSISDLATHPDPLVTVDELADYWRVHPKTLYRAIEKGALKAIQVGRNLRVRLIDARDYERTLTPSEDMNRQA